MPVLSSCFPFNKLTRSQHIPWDPGTLGLSDHLWPRSCFPTTTPRTPGHWKTVVVAAWSAWSVGNHQDLVEMESLQVGRNGTNEGALVGPRNVCLMCALECKSSKRLDLTWVDLISKPKPLSLALKKYVPFFPTCHCLHRFLGTCHVSLSKLISRLRGFLRDYQRDGLTT